MKSPKKNLKKPKMNNPSRRKQKKQSSESRRRMKSTMRMRVSRRMITEMMSNRFCNCKGMSLSPKISYL